MMSFFPLNVVVVHQLLVVVLDLRHIRDKYLESLFLRQHGSTCATFASS